MSSTSPAEAADTFALDSVHRLCARLDSIHDRQRKQYATEASQDIDTNTDVIRQLDSLVGAEVIHSKSLPSVKQLQEALASIKKLQQNQRISLFQSHRGTTLEDDDDIQLSEMMALARLTYAAYGLILDSLLKQAEYVGDQAWYWTEIEEDFSHTMAYFIQTLPERALNLITVVGKRIGEGSASFSSSSTPTHGPRKLSLNRSTIRQGVQIVRDSPAIAIGALFPLAVQSTDSKAQMNVANTKSDRVLVVSGARLLTPLGLTRHEARSKRVNLLKVRDAMAERLGTLALALERAEKDTAKEGLTAVHEEVWERITEMQTALLLPELSGDGETVKEDKQDLGSTLNTLLTVSLKRQHEQVSGLLSPAPLGLGTPTRLARLWPILILGPVSILAGTRIIMRSWDTIIAKAVDAKETVRGFAINWVYEPCIKLLDTIRTGDQEGVIMTRESLNSDLQSLERMVSDFSAEKYGLSGPQLEQVAARVREGDLTNVLKIYEDELKSPLRSAISGSLIRSLLIQIQKVKVDIAVAMRGVDQLLKSQQLLFGAIGIAPAMGIIYVVGGVVRQRLRIALGSQGKRLGQSTRFRAWEAMRRIDRLLADPQLSVGQLPAKTQGLLLLDLGLLRNLSPSLIAQVAAGKRSAKAKRLRTEFLRDVRDLESSGSETSTLEATVSTGLGWHARRAAVDRMWKSWGSIMNLVES